MTTPPGAAPGALPPEAAERAALRLAAGRALAARAMPYLATALFAVTPVERPGLGTFAVDARWRMYWDPAVCLALSPAEVAGAWLHETGHLLRSHAARWAALLEPDGRHPLWNRAADAAVNADLREAGIVLPAATAWFPERIPGAAAGMRAERMYLLLRDAAGPGGQDGDDADGDDDGDDAGGDAGDGPDCGSGAGGRRRAWEEPDPGDGGGPQGLRGPGTPPAGLDEGRAALLRRRVARDVAEHARSRGSVPGGWRRWAEELLEPAVDWRAELAAVVRRSTAGVAGLREHSYARPSRRAAALPGVVLPALRQPRPPVVRVVVDTSGSMSRRMLEQCLAEVAALTARVARGGGRPVEVIACDASAAQVQAVRSALSVRDLVLTGGGGTDLRTGMRAAAARRPRADLVVVLTDGETPWPEAPPEQAPRARYAAVLVRRDARRDQVPAWMHAVVVDPGTAQT